MPGRASRSAWPTETTIRRSGPPRDRLRHDLRTARRERSATSPAGARAAGAARADWPPYFFAWPGEADAFLPPPFDWPPPCDEPPVVPVDEPVCLALGGVSEPAGRAIRQI